MEYWWRNPGYRILECGWTETVSLRNMSQSQPKMEDRWWDGFSEPSSPETLRTCCHCGNPWWSAPWSTAASCGEGHRGVRASAKNLHQETNEQTRNKIFGKTAVAWPVFPAEEGKVLYHIYMEDPGKYGTLSLLTRKTCSGNTHTPEAWEAVHQTSHHSYKSKIEDNRSRKLHKLCPKII